MPVRLAMQIASGRVRRDARRIWVSTPQKPNLPGDESVSLFLGFTINLNIVDSLMGLTQF